MSEEIETVSSLARRVKILEDQQKFSSSFQNAINAFLQEKFVEDLGSSYWSIVIWHECKVRRQEFEKQVAEMISQLNAYGYDVAKRHPSAPLPTN